MAGRLWGDWRSFSLDERLALALPPAVGLLLPFLLGWSPHDSGPLLYAAFFWFLLFALPVFAFGRIIFRWAVEDEGIFRVLSTELRPSLPFMPLGSDAGAAAWPLLSLALIGLNTWVFLGVSAPWSYAFDSCEPINWVWTLPASMFLHADGGHILGNMVFLWVFGSALEGRVPRLRLLVLYLLAGVAAAGVYLLGNIALADPSCGTAIGASGAISGLMGLFLIRCPLNRVSLSAAPFGLPVPLAPRVQVPGVVLVGMFFALDLAGAREIAEGAEVTIGYWAHVGGYLFGIGAGYASGHHRLGAHDALVKRALASGERCDSGRAANARDSLLNSDPDHIDARLERARAQHRFSCSTQGAADYEHAIRLLIAKDRERAADVFIEYWRKYMRPLELRDQLLLTSALIARGQLDAAARSLEMAAQQPGVDPDLCATAHARETEILAAMGISRVAAPCNKEQRG